MQIPSVSPVYNLLNHVDGNQFKIYDLKSVFCTSDYKRIEVLANHRTLVRAWAIKYNCLLEKLIINGVLQ
jgi:hypothetical protein